VKTPPRKGTGRKPGLNPKQRRFAAEYAKDQNATQAAIRAGYSKKSAGKIGERLSKKAEIRALWEKRLEQVGMSANEVLTALEYIGDADPRQMFGEDGKLLHPKDMPERLRKAISSIEVNKGVIKVRFWSKTEALNLAGKTHKLFVERREVTGKDGADLFSVDAWRKMVADGTSDDKS
jgi:phage terminase small subunit